ncbi:MAG: dihydroorotate dehydrogenase-like protein [Actinomycetes bacterium]|nr:dihydroorotate dehydrogenase-like protein [Actinomycetes bacterium]MDX5380562.1 dihydroorotate dehydrogenase-like protein [Actinomycetes bacterium]MDX5399453.1 dihydroorotate dehydrogenase-like protein [Actinomycetes bacterium]MDX5450302.1 dihydroorotate dehydrogenase-like protein [Actinomycetes bacterium]
MDLTTTYLGLTLRNPLVASAGPLSQTLDGIKSLAEGGVGAVVLFSLFEEQLRREAARDIDLLERHEFSYAEALDYFPEADIDERSLAHDYLTLVERAARDIDIPVIASLNGADVGGWVAFGRDLENAGASALELNIYFVPGDLSTSGSRVIERHLDIVAAVKDAVGIPVAVKMSPYFSSVGSVALRLVQAGADGLVLFNRFLQPDVDIETLEANTTWALSTPDEGRLPRTWIAALRNHTKVSLAATTGVADGSDVVKNLLVGADVVMSTSALIRKGPGYARSMLDELETYLERKEFASLGALRGLLAVPAGTEGNALQRSSYVTAMEKAKATYGSL